MNLPLSAIAVVFVGALGLEDMVSNWSLIFMVSLPILSVKEVVLFCSFKDCFIIGGHLLSVTLCAKGVPFLLILFRRRLYCIYGGMAPSFDFVVLIRDLLIKP